MCSYTLDFVDVVEVEGLGNGVIAQESKPWAEVEVFLGDLDMVVLGGFGSCFVEVSSYDLIKIWVVRWVNVDCSVEFCRQSILSPDVDVGVAAVLAEVGRLDGLEFR